MCLIGGQLKGVEKGRDQLLVSVLMRCPLRGVSYETVD